MPSNLLVYLGKFDKVGMIIGRQHDIHRVSTHTFNCAHCFFKIDRARSRLSYG